MREPSEEEIDEYAARRTPREEFRWDNLAKAAYEKIGESLPEYSNTPWDGRPVVFRLAFMAGVREACRLFGIAVTA